MLKYKRKYILNIFYIYIIYSYVRGVRVEHFFGSGRVFSVFFGRVPECLRLLEPHRVLERLQIFERLRGWGSKF